jgi:hypothetical protein
MHPCWSCLILQRHPHLCDACDVAICGILLQESRPVAYFSPELNYPEARYSASDTEMLVLIAALREWRCSLEDCPVVIETDHQPTHTLTTFHLCAFSSSDEPGGWLNPVASPGSTAPVPQRWLTLCPERRSICKSTLFYNCADSKGLQFSCSTLPRMNIASLTFIMR